MSRLPGTVLVVDDDAVVRGVLNFALEVEGLSVRLRDDGPAALLAEAKWPPGACLVVDGRTSVMDGVEVKKTLRARDVTTPAILVTGRSSNQLARRAGRSGIRQVHEKLLASGAFVESARPALERSC